MAEAEGEAPVGTNHLRGEIHKVTQLRDARVTSLSGFDAIEAKAPAA